MTSQALLRRWLSLERGDGLDRARKASRWLSLAALILCMAVTLGIVLWELPRWSIVVFAVPIGWLIAERNALQTRIEQWPLVRKYIDWSRVDQDSQV